MIQREADRAGETKADRHTESDTESERQRQTYRHRENSNSKTLFYKDCSLGSVKNLTTSDTERDRQKVIQRETDRDRDRHKVIQRERRRADSST